MPRSLKELFSWKNGVRRRRHKVWNVITLTLMWVICKERNRRAFEGMERSFAQLRSSLRPLILLWCTHVFPVCIEDLVPFGEDHILYVSLFWYTHVYGNLALLLSMKTLLDQQKNESFNADLSRKYLQYKRCSYFV